MGAGEVDKEHDKLRFKHRSHFSLGDLVTHFLRRWLEKSSAHSPLLGNHVSPTRDTSRWRPHSVNKSRLKTVLIRECGCGESSGIARVECLTVVPGAENEETTRDDAEVNLQLYLHFLAIAMQISYRTSRNGDLGRNESPGTGVFGSLPSPVFHW